MSDAYKRIKKQNKRGNKGKPTDLIMCLSLEFFEKKNKDLPKVLKHLALCPGGLTNNDLIRIMPNWAKYVPILIKKSFIVEKPRINKEDPTVKKTNKTNKRQKIYQIDRSLSILILDSMDQEEINEYDKKIVQIIVDSSSKYRISINSVFL